MMRLLAVIPARWASSRFPGKPLAMIRGRSMIMRVYEKAELAGVFDKVVVATEDERILRHVHEAGGNAIMTSPLHDSGTARCTETLHLMKRKSGLHWDAVINIQGDEPLVDPGLLQRIARELQPGDSGILTMASPILHDEELLDPNTVKVVCDIQGNALYFSRSPIPYLREQLRTPKVSTFSYLKHLGLYAYYTPTLIEISALSSMPLEVAESLEQLRWLSNGFKIRVLLTDKVTVGVDVPEDIAKVEGFLDE